MKQLVLAIALIFATASVYAEEKCSCCKTVPEQLQDLSVTVRTNRGQGSGVIILRGDTNYVLTAGHVVASLRHSTKVGEKTMVSFDDLEVVQELIEEGRKVGVLSFTAKVVSYSQPDKPGEDLALLQLYKKDAYTTSVRFAKPTVPVIGTKLIHVGSLLGQFGSNSMTTGIMSQLGRVIEDVVYDQTSCTAFPGSSGGGVFTEDGRYVGMVVRGAGEGFNFIVPVRRIHSWSKRVHADWLFDTDAKVTEPLLEEGQNHADASEAILPPH